MPEADGIKQQIEDIYYDAVRAVGNGSAAMEDVNSAIKSLTAAKVFLQGSRVFALQQLEFLKLMLEKTKLLLHGSDNPEVMIAVGSFEGAKLQIEDYVNRIEIQVKNIEQSITIITYARRDQELDAAAVYIRNGLSALETFRSVL